MRKLITLAAIVAAVMAAPAAATAGTFVSDTMTGTSGTLLSSHTGETGATWTKHPSYSTGSAVLTDQNRVRSNVANVKVLYTASGVPASPDYTVDADMVVKTSEAQAGVTARTSTSTNDAYGCRYLKDSVRWELYKLTAGTLTVLASRTQTLMAGSTYHMALTVAGSTISCVAAGSSVGSATDASITAAGRVGVRLDQTAASNTKGLHVDNVVAVDAADTIPPDTTITASPPNPTTSTDASFSFTGTDNIGVTGFDCRLDGAAYAGCTSPKTYAGLAVGSHTFDVRAKDAAGNVDPTPASYTWTINPPADRTFDATYESSIVPPWWAVQDCSASGNTFTRDSSHVFAGSWGAKATVTATCSSPVAQRAEASGALTQTAGQFTEGEEAYFADSVYFDSSFPTSQIGHCLFNQLHTDLRGVNGQSPAYSTWCRKAFGQPDPDSVQFHTSAAGCQWDAPLTRNVWHHFVIRMKFSTSSAVGSWSLWYGTGASPVTYTQVAANCPVAALLSSSDYGYYKVGYYRGTGNTGAASIWHDDSRVGTTFASVAQQ